MTRLGTEVTQTLCLLTFSATVFCTTDGVDFTVHHLTKQTGFKMGYCTSGCAVAHPIRNSFSLHLCLWRHQALKPATM